ncbi:MAG TPA: hypothetical protein VER96_41000 [Polyangiaceae bacterium]|nr:hypothetical protein [Polyangiaceae bacterium]
MGLAQRCWCGCAILGVVITLGCAGVPTGVSKPLPPANADSAPGTLRVGTDEADGLRVLWNAPARGKWSEAESWAANDSVQFAALWREAGAMLPAPHVDFARYAVFALSHRGGVCQPEISSASVEPSGVVRLHAEDETMICIDLAVRESLVIALPRRVLKARALLVAPRYARAFEFSVPAAPVSAVAEERPRMSSQGESRLDPVPLPALGHLALASLRDGTQVWVARESNGSLSVISAVTSIERWPFARLPEYLETAVQWLPEHGRFQGGWDWQGHNVHGFASLTPHEWKLDAQGQLWVGGPIEALSGPIRPRLSAPELDTLARAYFSPRLSSWRDLGDGELALVELDLVSIPSLGVSLCQVPKQRVTAAQFRSCPSDAPRVIGAPEHPSAPSFVIRGPFILQRAGNAARVILYAESPEKESLGG